MIIQKFYIYLFLIAMSTLGISACKKKVERKWDMEKTVVILSDLRIIESQVNKHKYGERDSVKRKYFSDLLTIHGLNEEELKKELSIIQSDPILLKRIEEKIVTRFNSLKEALNNED